MLRKKPFCLSILLMLVPSLALACSGTSSASFYYQPWGQGTKYIVEDDNYGIDFPDVHLPQVKFNQLRLVPNIIVDEYDQPGEINNDFVMPAVFSNLIATGGRRFDWLTDGRHILWAGKIVRNPSGTPKVDVVTFRAYGRFAADKDSLYFDGERTDDNSGEKHVDMASLQQVGGNIASDDTGDVLKDSHNLYFQGRWLSRAQGYSILGVKSWDQRMIQYAPNTCETNDNPGPWDTILRTATQVFVNGIAIQADPDSFHVVRWLPGSLLIYRDKNGTNRYSFGKNCLDEFDVQRDKVTWMTRDASRRGDDCRVATIPDVDPEYFHPLNKTVAQYKDLLYQVKFVSAVDKELTVTRLPDPKQELKPGLNFVGKQIYFIANYGDGIQTADLAGQLTMFKKPNGQPSDIFAYDDRYVYFVGGGLGRNETRALDAAYINEHGDLVTVEGIYSDINNRFTPASELTKVQRK